MATISEIIIIYNPLSTGASKVLAKQLQASLRSKVNDIKIILKATEYAGHAEKLAYEYAKSSTLPLIFSSSGDGGYHEVVNGILRAQQDGHQAIAGLLPGGNANDHFNSLHDKDIVAHIIANDYRTIDVLALQGSVNGETVIRYAHSYIGFGLTPRIGHELTKAKLNRFNELWISLTTFMRIRTVALTINGKTRRYYSVICSNIDRMAKVLTLSTSAKMNDGKFEVSLLQKQHKLQLLWHIVRATIWGFYTESQASKITMGTVKPTLVQLDGETILLDANSEVVINCKNNALRCIV